jgi:hypothetical protein
VNAEFSALDDVSLARTLFNTIPLPVFMLDSEMRIKAHNEAGTTLISRVESLTMHQRGGDVWRCLQANAQQGCGHAESCKDCVIRQSVADAVTGRRISRRRARMEFIRGDKAEETCFLVTTTPFEYGGQRYVLLVLEDINELTALKRMLPICAKCKKIRDDQQYWHRLETYFHARMDVDFSHGLCPECIKELYPDLVPRLSPSSVSHP